MTVDLDCGAKRKMRLSFDRHPYPEGMHPYGYEPEIVNVIDHFVEPGDLAIDAGASIGFHTCLLAKLVGEEGLVLAFEPHGESFKFLLHHVHVVNKLPNVGCYQTALWKFDTPELELWSTDTLGYSSFHHYIGSAITSEKVEGRSLDSLLPIKEHPRLIKIDTEGTEAEVLLGAERILKKGVDCVILELNYHLLKEVCRSDHIIREYMEAIGYDMFLINITDGNGGFKEPLKVEPHIKIQIQGGHHINVMFSTEEKVNRRWKTDNT